MTTLSPTGKQPHGDASHLMEREFEPHENPNRSQIEKWRAEIISMRSLNWPYHRVAKWLEDEHGLSVSKEAVRKFCRVRNIGKGQGLPVLPPPQRPPSRVEKQPEEKLFKFGEEDAERAIRIDRE